jgi:hypothetical protein
MIFESYGSTASNRVLRVARGADMGIESGLTRDAALISSLGARKAATAIMTAPIRVVPVGIGNPRITPAALVTGTVIAHPGRGRELFIARAAELSATQIHCA